MRLIEHPHVSTCSLDKLMVLIRHGVDDPTLTHDLNQPLIEETKPDIRILGDGLIHFCVRRSVNRVFLYHSNRLRAIQTANIVAEQLAAVNMNIDVFETVGVREIYQGHFRITEDHVHGTEYKPLLDAWIAWQQKLDACELLYRFGDPVTDPKGKSQYPDLVGWFEKLGEHQADFSLRLYRLLEELFDDSGQGLRVIVGHQASCSRIQRILSAVENLENVDQFKPGEFVTVLEKQGERTTIEPACGVVIKKPDRKLALDVFRKEICFLKSII
jgi:broad specificity phosphatase PhoE